MADGGDRHKMVAPQGATGGGPHHLLVASGGSPPMRESPPKAVIDTSPILIDQNKESLKVKLLLRRPFDQLVAQGIMPPHKTPAAYHGQRRQLERAKTGDMLKAKIQQRPPRQELERRHILEPDTSHADPSLVERQRMLKKARLADQLNDQLSHRPGPLELIQKNILHTEEPIEQAVKTGKIPYKATSEGQLNRPQHPLNYINPEEDSLSSEGDSTVSPGPSDVIETAAKSAGIVVSLVQPTCDTSALVVTTNSAPVCPLLTTKDNTEVIFTNFGGVPLISHQPAPSPASLVSSTSTLSPLSSIASPVPSVVSQPPTPSPVIPPPPPPPVHLIAKPVQSIVKSDAPGKDKNRKKSKSKSAPKARTIKFHEYKGPPSAQKVTPPAGQSESSYDLLLKQQTLLLQFQLQLQHKYPQIILPAQQKPQTVDQNQTNVSNLNIQQPSPAPSTSSECSNNNTRIGVKLEDMKVSDLKAELKRRNLPVSGSKPQLIERLKPFTSSYNNNNITSNDNSAIINQNPPSVDSSVHSNISMDQSHNSPHYQDLGSPQESVLSQEDNKSILDFMELGDPVSPQPQAMNQEPILIQHQENGDNKLSLIQIVNHMNQTATQEDIVREQQRRIEELQRELTLSKMKLQAAQRPDPPKTQNMLVLQKHLQARQQQQNLANQMKQLQALQAQQAQVNEQQQKLQQQQHVAFQNQKNLGLVINGTTGDNNQKNLGLILNGPDAALVFNHLMQGKGRILNGQNGRSNSLPNFLSGIVTPIITTTPTTVKTEHHEEPKPQVNLTQPEIKIELTEVNRSPENVHMVNEADCNKLQSKKGSVKSQTVEDVLEILIKNGELPPSALGSYPTTPQSGGIKTQEPEYPSNEEFRNDLNNQINDNVQLDLQTNMNLVDNTNTNDAALGFNPQQLLEDLDNMDFSQLAMELGVNQNENNNLQMDQDGANIIPMETDEWLDSLMPQENQMYNGTNNSATIISNNINNINQDSCTTDLGNYGDPLLGIGNDPFDPFNLEEFRHPPDLNLTWDKLDFAT